MRIFIEETATTFKEIFDFEIKETGDQRLQETLSEIFKLSLPTQEGFEYIAIADPSGRVEIRYLRDRKSSDPFNVGEKQKIGRDNGYLMLSFPGNVIRSDVQKYMKDYLLGAWIETAKTAIKEIHNMHFARP